ncbi:CLC_0170 family protein [Lederbergia panacisoli]|uniref:CLC_0170 family protein n=1 Tax=Lederbergia panacisoli TaxID=1255251 RepID=UPI00214CCAB0|nr:CLC_0170 family protein [Lederbergia panacisoli]MCR2823017.1 hypothetical protein [Lederbergia panacisoli]
MHYLYYLVVLFIMTGIFILFVDAKTFKKIKMDREKKFSLFLGWTNVIGGTGFFIVYWAYQRWFW